jgi:PLP dependent protein
VNSVTLADRLGAVRERVTRAAARAGRDPAAIELIAVSKTQPAELVLIAAQAGQRLFGENRIDEAIAKMATLRERAPDINLSWHMIGHVQSRKAAAVVGAGMRLIHSVDSLKLAERISRLAVAAGRSQTVLLEFNVSGETSKAGFAASETARWGQLVLDVERAASLPGIEIIGCMTMAPISTVGDAARPYFARLRELRDYLAARVASANWTTLSMGMSDDLEAAVTEGSTMVRVGRAIFGDRA